MVWSCVLLWPSDLCEVWWAFSRAPWRPQIPWESWRLRLSCRVCRPLPLFYLTLGPSPQEELPEFLRVLRQCLPVCPCDLHGVSRFGVRGQPCGVNPLLLVPSPWVCASVSGCQSSCLWSQSTLDRAELWSHSTVVCPLAWTRVCVSGKQSAIACGVNTHYLVHS